MPLKIDYLQIDLEVNNRSTLTTLELLDAQVFDNYKFEWRKLKKELQELKIKKQL